MLRRAARLLGFGWMVAATGGCGAPQIDAATRARLPHSQTPQVTELDVSRSAASYPVSGLSAAELSRSMYAHAAANWSDPQAVGMTEASIPIEARCQEYSDGGGLLDAKISLSLVVHLPDWQERERAPAALQQSWARFFNALTAHEEGHVRIAVEHATALRGQLAASKLEDSCEVFMTRFKERTDEAHARMERAQADYDAKTEHGIKQGCVL